MAPTPDTVGPIVRMSSESGSDDTNKPNQYTNDAFVKDEMHHDDDQFKPMQTETTASQAHIATPAGNEPPKIEKTMMKTSTLNSSMRRSTVETISPNIDFDDILPHIGEFGTYQKILFFLMIPFAFSVAFVYFSQIFLTLVPDKHWCHIHELTHLSIEQR